MNLMDLTEILKYFLSTSSITIGIVYVIKLCIDKFAESKIENYKASLEKDSELFKSNLNIEAENFRHQLNIVSVEHQIRYSKLYEERGQVIKLLYSSLIDLEECLLNLTTPWQGPDWTRDLERDNKAKDAIKNLRIQVEQSRIFLSESLCQKIESILFDSKQISDEMYLAKSDENRNQKYRQSDIKISVEELLNPSSTWRELDAKVKNEIKAAKLDIAQEFRSLIGVV